MKNAGKQPDRKLRAFSLVETVVVVTLAALIMVSVLQIYNRVRGDAGVILGKLDEDRMAQEILQRIAEDVDRLSAQGFESNLQVRSKVDHGFFSSYLDIQTRYSRVDNPRRPEIYEQVTWNTWYDTYTDSLVLYRGHKGLNLEDKILEENKNKEERDLHVPIAWGVTLFEVLAVEDQKFNPSWVQNKPPKGIRIGISFAPPEELPEGGMGIPENKIMYRTIAVDRTRPIEYRFVPKVYDVNDFLREDMLEEDDEETMEEQETMEEEPTEPPLPDETE